MKQGKKIYYCKKCGWVTDAQKKGGIGTAHAHAEKHAKAFGIIPAWIFPSANPEKLDTFIEKINIKSFNYGNTPIETEVEIE